MPNDLPDWARFAPSLAHLIPMITAQDAVLCGWGSGPQPQATNYDPSEPEHLAVCVDDPWQTADFWVTINANGCRWFEGDGDMAELWECSHEAFFAFLAQLPRRLHTFGRCVG